MSASLRVITLLTDFGTRDPFVGIMKGVILSLCPNAHLIDLTHEIPPGDICAGALALKWAAPHFPPGTIHLAVVDPGVGSPRQPLVLRPPGNSSPQWPASSPHDLITPSPHHSFVGPDNGLLWPAAAGAGQPEAWTIDLSRWDRPVSATFHGRDVFAPAAARLAAGAAPASFCLPAADVTRLDWPCPVLEGSAVHGEVIAIDRFGNAITNLAPPDLGMPAPDTLIFSVAGRRVRGPSPYYAAVPPGDPVILLGSAGLYEIALNQAHAAATLGLQIGSPLEARPPDD